MTDILAALPPGYVVHLPPPANAPRVPHVLGPAVTIMPELSISGHEQVERTCTTCGAVKITIIGEGDNHRRAWRKSADAEQLETYVEPPCEPFKENQRAL
jgi:hypothetical protein